MMSLENMSKWKKPDTRGHVRCDSVSGNHLEHTGRSHSAFSGPQGWGEGSKSCVEEEGFASEPWGSLEPGRAGGCTALWMSHVCGPVVRL